MEATLKIKISNGNNSSRIYNFGKVLANLHISDKNHEGYYSSYNLWNRWVRSLRE